MLPNYTLLARRTVASAIAALGTLAIAPLSAQAGTLNFSVEWFFGSLAGTQGTGSVTYDDTAVPESGAALVNIDSFKLDLEDNGLEEYSYSLPDINAAGSVTFVDGQYQGLNFTIKDLLTVYASSTPGESTAIYQDGTVGSLPALGVLKQADPSDPSDPGDPDPVLAPEPGSLLGLLAVGAAGTVLRRRSRLSQTP
jgi:hypothetical protein